MFVYKQDALYKSTFTLHYFGPYSNNSSRIIQNGPNLAVAFYIFACDNENNLIGHEAESACLSVWMCLCFIMYGHVFQRILIKLSTWHPKDMSRVVVNLGMGCIAALR